MNRLVVDSARQIDQEIIKNQTQSVTSLKRKGLLSACPAKRGNLSLTKTNSLINSESSILMN